MMKRIQFIFAIIRQGIPCMFHAVTGLYCPGCGGTRACKYLLHGDILKSIQYHPLVLYMAAVFLLEVASYALSKCLHRPKLHVKRYMLFIYIGVAVVVVNWLVKNYMLVVRGVDLLP